MEKGKKSKGYMGKTEWPQDPPLVCSKMAGYINHSQGLVQQMVLSSLSIPPYLLIRSRNSPRGSSRKSKPIEESGFINKRPCRVTLTELEDGC